MSLPSLLRGEINSFKQDLNRVKHVLSDTSELFEEIEQATQLSGVRLSGESFTEEDDIRRLINSPPSLVIFGQSQRTKAKLVNQIFDEPIYPDIPTSECDNSSWRMVRFRYGRLQTVGLTLPDQYELVDNLVAYDRPWKTLPVEDIKVKEGGDGAIDGATHAVLDVQLSNHLMKEGLDIVVTPSNTQTSFIDTLKSCTEDVLSICLYAVSGLELTDKEVQQLSEIEENNMTVPMLFINVGVEETPSDATSNSSKPKPRLVKQSTLIRMGLYEQLARIGFVTMVLSTSNRVSGIVNGESVNAVPETDIVEEPEQLPQKLCKFVAQGLRNSLITMTTMLHLVHKRSLNNFIMRAFDMQRDMMITPKRLEFARTKEQELSDSLLKLALEKQEEIKVLVSEAIQSARTSIVRTVADYEFIGVTMNDELHVATARDLRICNGQIRELVIGRLNHEIAGKLVESINILRESYIGTLTRCIDSLEQQDRDSQGANGTVSKEGHAATSALRQILNAAYQINVQINPGSTVLRNLVDKMKQLIQSLPWNAQPKMDGDWKQKTANDMLDKLNENKLAKSIGEQFRDNLKQSHDHFTQAMKTLELHHTGRLEKAGDRQQKLRKIHAPKVAKLAMESSSLRDFIMHGMPVCGREIGRGQYGVVYSCDEWANIKPCAIKSVVPPDEKHMNDLALEFYYTKNVPEHDRVIGLRGSVIDYSYGGGTTPAVLIIMERMSRDFYTAIKSGFGWMSRLQVAIDVVEGIRFLHSQGLVHRDIKLKNVLLCKEDGLERGKITDLGFCKPEAMMSGSIVGTPIHMAPELFSGFYDNSVDVYAFGVLFWYVCAGHVRLPLNFEQCSSKDQLFNSVKKGMRPERLSAFDEDCWELMSQCWDTLPARRPLTGTVEETLLTIYNKFKKNPELVAAKNVTLTEPSSSRKTTGRRRRN